MPDDVQVLTAEQARADKDTKELTKLAATVAKTADAALVIQDDVQYARAGEVLIEIKAVLNNTEKKRKALTAPILKHKADIDSFFKEFTGPLEDKEKSLKNAIGEYTIRREQERQAAQRAMEAETKKLQAEIDLEAEKKGVETVQLAVPQLVDDKPELKGVAVKMLWTYEITDVDQIPREFLTVDTTKINAAVKGGARNIPGVKIYQTHSTAVRA